MDGKKILITGGAGFIGSKLGYQLSQKGYEVTIIDDLSGGYEDNLLVNGKHFSTFVKKDIRDADIGQYFKGVDTVFHLAAISALPVCQSEPGRAISVNTAGTAAVLEASRRNDVRRVIFASTSAIYENNSSYPCREDDAVRPNLMYSTSKYASELLCRGFSEVYGMELAITRYYNVYGPNQDVRRKSPPFVGYVIRELLSGKPPMLHSNGEQRRDYVFIDDVNELNMLLMDRKEAAGNTFNVASGVSYSVNEIYSMVARLAGTGIKPAFREATKFWDKYPDLYEGRYCLDGKRLAKEVDKFTLGSTFFAKEKLGWSAKTPMETGLKITVDHAKKVLAGKA